MRISPAPWAKSSAGAREGEELGRDRHLREAAERAEAGHAIARFELRSGRRAADDPGNLAAGHEGQRRFQLVLPARLQHLGERHAGGVDVDHDAGARREHVRGLGLVQLDQLQRAVGAGLGDDLDGFHRGEYDGPPKPAIGRARG